MCTSELRLLKLDVSINSYHGLNLQRQNSDNRVVFETGFETCYHFSGNCLSALEADDDEREKEDEDKNYGTKLSKLQEKSHQN